MHEVFLIFLSRSYVLSDLPEVQTITVQIYKEVDGKNKKEKRKPVGMQYVFFRF